jgi:short-subunit dehydrogenase
MQNDFRHRYGEWAIVTGASSGIGEAFAHVLAERGIPSLLVARRESELARVTSDIQKRHGLACLPLALDLADPASLERLSAEAAGLDVGLVIGNAASNPAGAFLDLSAEELQRMLAINARANLLLARAFLPRLAQRGRGGFLIVGSTEGFAGIPWSACYSATKAFVLNLGEALWGEFRGQGIDVLVLAPGATDTPLLASRKLDARRVAPMAPQDVARIGLDQLGKGPVVIPGTANRWMFGLLRHLPRHWLVSLAGRAMRGIVQRARGS